MLGKTPIRMARFAAMCMGFITLMSTAEAASVQRGRNFAIANCATCHSIDRYTPSPLPIAPAFRDLHLRYKVETLEEALAEGLVTGHMNMPEFRLEPDQISDFISFLKNFER